MNKNIELKEKLLEIKEEDNSLNHIYIKILKR